MGLTSGTNAQSGGPLQASASATVTATDNMNPGQASKSADVITRLTAGLAYASAAGAVQGHAKYDVTEFLYARHGDRNALRHSLLADLAAELVQGRAYVDLRASVAQSAVSAFGPQVTDDGRNASNAAEVATLALSPRLNGVLLGQLAYAASGTFQANDAAGTSRGDGTSRLANLSLSPVSAGRLSWNLAVSHQVSSIKLGLSTETDRVTLGTRWLVPEADLSLSASAGREYGDLVARTGGAHDIWSAGLVWTPSPLTALDLSAGRRPTGGLYQAGLTFRTPLTIWRASFSRNVVDSSVQSTVSQGTNYDLFFAQFASVEPDPVKRDALVTAFLSRSGLSPDGVVKSSFLTSAQTIDQRVDLSVAWRDNRSTAVVNYLRGVSRRADNATVAVDDLADTSRVRNASWSVSLSHQLTPALSSSMSLSDLHNRGDRAEQSSKTRRAYLSLVGTVTSRESWTLSLRRSLNESALKTYSESAISGAYSLQF
ncbi:TIGR03016 family PEP-CTERM system-associated outer membrane protein [Ideonella sp. DXS22W]|uniref:TIGR03016 family PEP-CTERM system-associated outer membrane protein n=1 Tax=Pseudaquabacterium inlustre TaxID=2984192 RepID=A0ABU9CRZ1_9BURK